MRRVIAALSVSLLTACATPAQVEEGHRLAQERYVEDMRTAVEWNTHAGGIPASGWVFIWIFGIVVAAVVVGVGLTFLHEATTRRRKDRQDLAMEREHTRQVAAKRGHCPTCGTPAIDMANQAGQET